MAAPLITGSLLPTPTPVSPSQTLAPSTEILPHPSGGNSRNRPGKPVAGSNVQSSFPLPGRTMRDVVRAIEKTERFIYGYECGLCDIKVQQKARDETKRQIEAARFALRKLEAKFESESKSAKEWEVSKANLTKAIEEETSRLSELMKEKEAMQAAMKKEDQIARETPEEKVERLKAELAELSTAIAAKSASKPSEGVDQTII